MINRKKYEDIALIRGLRAELKIARVFEIYLYDFYSTWIRHGQNRYHLSESDSLDCYIDAYMSLLKTIRQGNFDENKKIAPFFKTVFDRKCVDLIRKITNNKNKGTDSLDDLLEMSSEATSALENLITLDFMSKIRPVLEKLGENCRNIIHLWSRGYAHKEIAAQLETVSNDKSSKAILNKCLRKIRERVDFV